MPAPTTNSVWRRTGPADIGQTLCSTGSDDFSTCFLHGVPFKYASTSRRHTRFVQSVAYSPSGALFASAGADGQVLLYDGTTGEDKGALVDGEAGGAAHAKTVFAVSFSGDGTTVATSGADGRTKLWDVESGTVLQTWSFDEGDDVASQQVVRPLSPSLFPSYSFANLSWAPLSGNSSFNAQCDARRATPSPARPSSRSPSPARSTSSTPRPPRPSAPSSDTRTPSLLSPSRLPTPTRSSAGTRPGGSSRRGWGARARWRKSPL